MAEREAEMQSQIFMKNTKEISLHSYFKNMNCYILQPSHRNLTYLYLTSLISPKRKKKEGEKEEDNGGGKRGRREEKEKKE